MIPAYINAYAGTEEIAAAVMDAVMGRSPFEGTNPIDPFCGREELAL